jgi:hypothetical protein
MGIFRRRLLIRAALSAVPELPDWFRKSLILWYSIPRQKATNGSLAASPLLVDFSGNGMDGTLYNFSFSGLSGLNGYATNYMSGYMYPEDIVAATFDEHRIHVTSIYKVSPFIKSLTNVLPYVVKVSGLAGGLNLIYSYYKDNKDTGSSYIIEADGDYTLPRSFNVFTGFKFNKTVSDCDVTLEVLPAHPEYLFFDGVDDRLRTAAAFDADVGTVLMEMMDMTDGASKFQTFFDVEIVRTYFQRTSGNMLTTGAGNTLGVEGNIYRIDYSPRHLSSKLSVGANVYSKEFSLVGLRQMMMFNRNLTEKEYEWIKLNLMK